jgi:hypothetical protein
MIGSLAFLMFQSALAAAFNPNANELFDRDSTLKAWAISQFDTNHDGWLTLYEAQPAIAAFRQIADGDSDGRITVVEFRRAKEFIAARW